MQKRRYEILLPLKHNDGRPVPAELFEQTREELIAQFGGITLSPRTVLGAWSDEEMRYEDELIQWIVDVDNTDEHRQFFIRFKQLLLERFEQIEIYLVSYPVEIL